MSAPLEKQLRELIVGWSMPFADLAITIVFGSQLLHELLFTESGKKTQERCVGHNDQDWQRYYTSVLDWACDLPFDTNFGPIEINAEFLRFVAAAQVDDSEERQAILQALQELKPEELTESVRSVHAVMVEGLCGTIEAALGDGPEPLSDEEVKNFETSPSTSFLIRVCVPCLMCHQRMPQQLYAAATGGNPDLNALEQLVRIDRELVYLPEVRSLRQRIQPTQREDFDSIVSLAGSGPGKPLKRPQVKTALGGFLAYVADLFDQPVTRPQLNQLFDIAWGIGAAEEAEKDPDFWGIQPGSFSRNVRRYMKKWENLLADNEIRQAVSDLRKRAA